MGEDIDLAFWRRYAQASSFLNLFICVIDTIYIAATWGTGSHRLLLLVVNSVALVGVLAGLATTPETRIAESRHRDLIFATWCSAGIALITFAVWADGGLRSPLAWLFPLSVMFTATVHRPRIVGLAGALALAGFLAVGAVDHTLTRDPAALVVRACYLVALGYAAATAAHFRWTHYEAQIALREQLGSLADHDGLTGLFNHRAFHEHLGRAIATAARQDDSIALLAIDLDHFKDVNDSHGHIVGDEVLRAVARTLLASARAGDLVARLGGEEFAVLLPGAGAEAARGAAERMRVAIEAMASPVAMTASIGVSTSRATATSSSALLEQADSALYAAKRGGRNQVCWLRVA